jgi:hypothetical protein
MRLTLFTIFIQIVVLNTTILYNHSYILNPMAKSQNTPISTLKHINHRER